MNRYLQKKDLLSGFHEAGIGAGDTLFLHSDAIVTAQMGPKPQEERFHLLLDALMEAIGPEGTLIVPTFTYSFCRNEVFDVWKTPCLPKDVGLFPEFVRNRERVTRSLCPIFSVAALGRHAGILRDIEIGDCFGAKSIFGWLHQRNAKIVWLACPFDRVTFVHYVEQHHGVPYRYHKSFVGRIVTHQGDTLECCVNYYVRDYEKKLSWNLGPLKKRLEEKGKMKTGVIGRVGLLVVTAGDFFDEVSLVLKENPYGLMKDERN